MRRIEKSTRIHIGANVLAWVLILQAGCDQKPTTLIGAAPQTTGGVIAESNYEYFKKTLTDSSGAEVRYTVFIPPTYEPGTAVPLIFYLHDGGGVGGLPYYGGMSIKALVEPAFRQLGAIIVAPDSGDTGWSSPRNEEVIAALISKMTSDYTIDPQRTLLLGFSMGGHGTWHHAQKHEDFFHAAIPMAGRPLTDKTDWKIALYVIHSRDDKQVAIEPTETYVGNLRDAGCTIETNFVSGLSHREVEKYVEPLLESVPWLKNVWSLADLP